MCQAVTLCGGLIIVPYNVLNRPRYPLPYYPDGAGIFIAILWAYDQNNINHDQNDT